MVAQQDGLKRQDQADLAAGFQAAVVDVLTEKTKRALQFYLASNPDEPTVAVAGGVAANQAIRQGLEALAVLLGTPFTAPPMAYAPITLR